MPPTHEVTNQVPPLVDYDVADDPALLESLRREGADWAEPKVRELGVLAGSEQAQEWGRLANENPPVLHTHDRVGRRIDEVEFHPYWHQPMATAVSHGLHAAPWRQDPPRAHVARAAECYVWGQVEVGHTCASAMTYSAVPARGDNAELATDYEALLAAPHYGFGLRVITNKRGLIAGMSMTEKQ